MHAKGGCFLQHSGVDDFVLSRDTHNSPQATQVKAFQAILMLDVRGPGRTAIQQGAKDTCLIILEFSV